MRELTFLAIYLGLPDVIQPIRRDGIVISFEYRRVFSNVMDITIIACNTNPVPLHEVVMDFKVPPVSIHSFFCCRAWVEIDACRVSIT